MKYFSLSDGQQLFEGVSDNEEIWKMFRHGNDLYFQAFNELFIFDGRNVRKLRLKDQISYCYLIDNEIYVATVRNGVQILRDGKFYPKPNWDSLKGNVIHHIGKYDGKRYIFTKNNGVFIDVDGTLEPWQHPLNPVLKNQIINTAKFSGDHTLSIGTGLKGLYIIDMRDGSWQNINRQNALHNNAVLSITTDKENDLWLGLDNGICHIEINSPVSVFLDNSGELGSVYALSPIAGGYLFATNHGLFTSDGQKLSVVPDSQGQVWDIFKSGTGFIIGHNDGTYAYDGKQLQSGNSVNGGWKFIASPYDKVWFQANYSGVAVYKDKNDLKKWKTLEGLTKPIRNIAQEMPGELWAADNYRSLYRVTYNKDFVTTAIENVSQKNGFANDFGVKIFPYSGKILFLIANHWYTYDRQSKKLVKDQPFDDTFAGISDIIPIDSGHFLVVRSGLLYFISEIKGKFIWKLIPEKYYQGKLIIENIRAALSGNHLLINLDDGFMSFQRNKVTDAIPKVSIEAFLDGSILPYRSDIKFNQPIEFQIISEY